MTDPPASSLFSAGNLLRGLVSFWCSRCASNHPIVTFSSPPIPAGNLLRGLVSCTGAQFCSLALIETKNRALEVRCAVGCI